MWTPMTSICLNKPSNTLAEGYFSTWKSLYSQWTNLHFPVSGNYTLIVAINFESNQILLLCKCLVFVQFMVDVMCVISCVAIICCLHSIHDGPKHCYAQMAKELIRRAIKCVRAIYLWIEADITGRVDSADATDKAVIEPLCPAFSPSHLCIVWDENVISTRQWPYGSKLNGGNGRRCRLTARSLCHYKQKTRPSELIK